MKSKQTIFTSGRKERMTSLLRLSHELGRDDRRMAILAEGNTSAKLSPKLFL